MLFHAFGLTVYKFCNSVGIKCFRLGIERLLLRDFTVSSTLIHLLSLIPWWISFFTKAHGKVGGSPERVPFGLCRIFPRILTFSLALTDIAPLKSHFYVNFTSFYALWKNCVTRGSSFFVIVVCLHFLAMVSISQYILWPKDNEDQQGATEVFFNYVHRFSQCFQYNFWVELQFPCFLNCPCLWFSLIHSSSFMFPYFCSE